MQKKTVSALLLTLLLLSMLTLALNTQPVRASGTIYIRPDGTVEGTDKIQRDGDVYTFTESIYDEVVVERDNIIVDGAGYTLQGIGSGTGILIVTYPDTTGRTNITIKNTEIKSFDRGIFVDFFSNHCNISGNQITNNRGAGIRLYAETKYNTISGNNITNNGSGISLYMSSSNTIFGNQITNNGSGISGESVGYSSISGNQITNNGSGIQLDSGAYYISISGNQITNNVGVGIHLDYSAVGNTISGNNITNNGSGIALGKAGGNSICGNNIANNGYSGISFWEAWGNSISENNITNNKYGISLGLSSNTIYHNNFVNNENQVYGWWSQDIWDDGYPSGGNYWSDHITVDRRSGVNQDHPGSDGIVDEPYIIINNRDNYPLVEPWSPRPPPPQEDLEELIGTIVSWNLPEGTENSLTSKLEEAIHLLNKGNDNGAIHKLTDLINQVEALRSKGKLEDWQADYLITETQRIIDLING